MSERPELSEKNPYWIPKERYYELKHFCLQYTTWKKMLAAMNAYPRIRYLEVSDGQPDPVGRMVEHRERYFRLVKVIEDSAMETDRVIGKDILRGVISGCSYEVLNTRQAIPCCKDIYYELYRKFFWILDKKRDA